MHYVALKLTVRGRHSMSQELTLLLHQNVKSAMDKILAKELPHCENVAFTAGEWQSRDQNPYILLMIHYINRKFEMRKFTVACKSVGWRPKDICAKTMVHDIGMDKEARESDAIDHQIYCLDHVINNVLKEALPHEKTMPFVVRVRETDEGFHRSVKWCTTLLNKSTDYVEIPKPCTTSWNSVCCTIDAIGKWHPRSRNILRQEHLRVNLWTNPYTTNVEVLNKF